MVFMSRQKFASGHQGVIRIDPTAYESLRHARTYVVFATLAWRYNGWCTHEERQLFLNEVWTVLDSYEAGQHVLETFATNKRKD